MKGPKKMGYVLRHTSGNYCTPDIKFTDDINKAQLFSNFDAAHKYLSDNGLQNPYDLLEVGNAGLTITRVI